MKILNWSFNLPGRSNPSLRRIPKRVLIKIQMMTESFGEPSDHENTDQQDKTPKESNETKTGKDNPKRGPRRPRIMRTGLPGRPKKEY